MFLLSVLLPLVFALWQPESSVERRVWFVNARISNSNSQCHISPRRRFLQMLKSKSRFYDIRNNDWEATVWTQTAASKRSYKSGHKHSIIEDDLHFGMVAFELHCRVPLKGTQQIKLHQLLNKLIKHI